MGRIKTAKVKRITLEMAKAHAGAFSADFEANKAKLAELGFQGSKKLRNVVAGYLARLAKQQKIASPSV